MTQPDDIKAQIAGEIYTALERLDADQELLAIVGSWRDTRPPCEGKLGPDNPAGCGSRE